MLITAGLDNFINNLGARTVQMSHIFCVSLQLHNLPGVWARGLLKLPEDVCVF